MKLINSLFICCLLLSACTSEKLIPEESSAQKTAIERFTFAYDAYIQLPVPPKLAETHEERKALREKAYEQKKLVLKMAKEYGDQLEDPNQTTFQHVYDSIKAEVFTEDVKVYLENAERLLSPRKEALQRLGVTKIELEKFYPEIHDMEWKEIYTYVSTKNDIVKD